MALKSHAFYTVLWHGLNLSGGTPGFAHHCFCIISANINKVKKIKLYSCMNVVLISWIPWKGSLLAVTPRGPKTAL